MNVRPAGAAAAKPWIYVVSLKRAVDRRTEISRQLASRDLDYEFVDAFDAKVADASWLRSHVNEGAVARNMNRPLTSPEIACCLSHRLVYQHIVNENRIGGIVLEDDVTIADGFERVYAYLGRIGSTIASAPAVYHLTAAAGQWSRDLVLRRRSAITMDSSSPFREWVPGWSGEPWGTCGYYVTQAAASSLLMATAIETVADHWSKWASASTGRIYIAVPAVVIHPANSTDSEIEAARRKADDGPETSTLRSAVAVVGKILQLVRARVLTHIVRPVARWFL